MDPVPRPNHQWASDWMLLVFLFTLIALAYTRKHYPFRINRLWTSTWNVRALRQAIREEPNTPRANLLFNVNHSLIFGLFIYLTLHIWQVALTWPPFVVFMLIVASVAVGYTLKIVAIRTVQFLAEGDFGLNEYAYNVNLINRVVGLILFPILALMVYLPKNQSTNLWWCALLVVMGMLLYRVFRGIRNAIEGNVPLFYIFFYICTLEILPWIVCARFLTSHHA
jgi:hypothetical protein